MKRITLTGTDIVSTPLGFGCAGLMRIPTSRGRQEVLNAAFDSGIRHFDVARMYGLGQAEAEIGRFIKGRRSDLVIATKFGIEMNQSGSRLAPLMNMARYLVKLVPSIRRMAKNRTSNLYQRRYDKSAAQESLDKSLAELQTDYVDLFLLHEPELEDLENTDILEFLVKSKEQGKIRAYGIAGYPEQCMKICEGASELVDILQIPNDAVNQQFDQFTGVHGGARITFSPFSSVLREIVEYVRADLVVQQELSRLTGRDCTSYDVVSKILLKYCLDKNPDGVVLFSTTNAGRISNLVDVINDELDSDVIDTFSSVVKEGTGRSA